MSQTVIEFGDAQAVFNNVCKQMNRLNWSAVKAKRLQKEKEDEKVGLGSVGSSPTSESG